MPYSIPPFSAPLAPGVAMSSPDLHALLAAKEARMRRRRSLQRHYPGVALSLSVNMPGPVKDSADIRDLFDYAVSSLQRACALQGWPVRACRVVYADTGPHAVLVVQGEAAALKQAACTLEEEQDYGRLLDVDVYDTAGHAVRVLERPEGRHCFVCAEPAALCMRGQRHSPEELLTAVQSMLVGFRARLSRDISPPAACYGALGLEAMLHEAAACPSPGLVDPLHRGSHSDMDFFTFQRSSAALGFSLCRCVQAGMGHREAPPALLPVLRRVGREAEKDMLRATDGVNTQKGLLFSLGLTLGATGLLLRDGLPVTPEALGHCVRQMTGGMVERELHGELEHARHTSAPLTAGQRAWLEFGIAGIRGEVEAGFPSVLQVGLPTLEQALTQGEHTNKALLRTLLALMSTVNDTTILARSGRHASLLTVQRRARVLLDSGLLDSQEWKAALWALDAALVDENLSPGGSADLLAVTWFMHRCRAVRP